MPKILILDCTGHDWTDKHLALLPEVKVSSIYSQINLIKRATRRACYCLNIPNKSIWYGDWKNELQDYDIVIVFSALFGPDIFGWIRRTGYKGRLILYYRDPQSASYLRDDCKAEYIHRYEPSTELWTFDAGDALKYRMMYNPQFYFRLPISDIELLYDAVFIGSARERIQEINLVYETLINAGCKTMFLVRASKEEAKKLHDGIITIKKNIPYEKILEYNQKSKAIIEINQAGQSGLTVRALEAMFLNKKLITDNTLVRDMDFFNAKNVFIFDKSSPSEIRKFLLEPMDKVNENILNKYSAEQWLERFIRNR